ncbi:MULTISPECIES: hypothetical protein [Roseobacteraceae]|uniref:Uncharacterized protein n=1 Tax=Falsiruegeria litorea TaxID=1280831 RepID=A0ABS5WVD0_9RHOB|nr:MULTISPECIES: hypothetical protein [Roseobacteraceae]MBT3141790.1 hypothetical protein [Falsiruegeria litorea]MBT8168876.1 hypothetical protein [Falsiruegeria litorea]
MKNRAITFSFQPPESGAGSTPLTTDVNIIGNSLSVGQAKLACDERTASG